MRRMIWLPLVLAGCAGSDADPVRVAERFHALRATSDDGGIHALLTDADQAAVPLQAFPAALPPGLELELFSWSDARLDSAALLNAEGDTAAVVLHVSGAARDTLRLLATHRPLKLWRFELDRVRWRVSMGLAERARLDSLAASLRSGSGAPDSAAVGRARAYLRVAERNPALARPADADAARGILARAAVTEALRVDVRITTSFTGTRLVEGRVENPTATRIATLTLVVRDAAGNEERIELWDIPPRASTPVWHMTRLRDGRLTHRLERIQVF